ncbi:centrosomal protein of 126 kDa isoform X2 [Stegostoma tigrinum]|uniref:centrosomal protein of 126 kDa isoform X2 n=1 Tax=Stegostoma tigrinum TaxID=3053191 RepID=UPI00202B87A1|nr:centrosomal protein of 126 kDa isoform X2 [Stegostoma tigrinum]
MWRDRPVSSVNIKTQLEGLDEERQRLEEEQKTNRAKVRKLTLQTIRRRKALEEKRKDNEEKEQKFREEVLQERKLKQQEATERFQRAHLPPSQRRQNRIGHRKRAIRLEEALEQVQGSSCGSASSSYVIAKSTVNKWTTDLLLNLSPHEIRNGSRYQIQLSEAKAYAKLMQERSGANLQNSRLYFQRELEETQRLLGEQQLNSLQEFQQEIDQLYQSEILSSLDSLETEGQNTTHQTEPIESNSLSVQINHTSNNRVKPHPPVKDSLNSCRTDFYPLKNTHISAWINNLDSSQTSLSSAVVKTNGTEASATKEYLSDKQHTLAFAKIDSECFDSGPLSSVERYQNESSTKLYNNNQHKIIENNAHSIESHPTTRPSSESSLGHTAHSATRPCNAWSTPDPTPREATQVSDVNDRLESVHQNEPVTLHSLKLPLATPFFLNFSPKSQLFSDRRNTDSIKESQKTVEQNHLLACTGATNQINQKADFSSESEGNHASSNKYNLGIKSRHGSEGASQKSAPSQAAFNSSESDSENNVTEGKEKKLAAHSSMSTTRLKTSKNYFYEKSNFNLLKGILKKASKYDNGYPKSVLSATGVLGIQMASSIRDSVELIKMKETESVKNPTKKKLRWFDEIEQTNQFTKVPNKDAGEELEITKDSKSSGSTSQSQVQSPCSENNGSFTNGKSIVESKKESKWTTLNTGHKTAVDCSLAGRQQTESKGAVTDPVILETASVTHGITPAVPPQYHLTKQAWAATETRNIDQKITVKNTIIKPEKPMVRKGHSKVIKRAHSAKVYFCTRGNCRKGTIIRPQSASEAMKSQGKILIPHPPSRLAIDSKHCQRTKGNFNSSCQSQMQPANVIDNSSTKSREFIPDIHYTSSKDNADKTAVSGLWPQKKFSNNTSVAITTFPSSYLVSPFETVPKATYSVNTTKSVLQQGDVNNGTKQDSKCGGDRLRLDSTPTDEEIALLWHGVRSALARKDVISGDARNYLSSRNNGHKTNLQHHRTNVSQLSIDGSTLMNGMRSVSRGDRLLSAPSVAFTRRNHPTDTHSSGIKYRALLEQRRMNIGSTTHKSDQIGQNFQISPFPSAFDPVQTINAAQNSEEVSQSTEQFMLAENMVETSAQDSDILSAMETIETQQYSFLQNKVQRLGLSALSFEEQKLLQSLDRLDKRLQCHIKWCFQLKY